ncbi:amidohydrolase [Cesiribacter sp. SM1]|uniref:amidohydrolase family protein n=1 Tax=Cesiribacter sp. SM1 TaxID=2861196 RepID=UPI001CD3FE52|nr:amidohydrolase family protein [Cesiribacter sp. SM1]
MEVVDAHNHYWQYNSVEFGWMGAEHESIKRDFLPHHLASELEKHNITATVAVQARESMEENSFLLALAAQHSVVKGVVGWADFRADTFEQDLHLIAEHPKLVGLRHFVQSRPEGYMLQESFQRGIAALKALGLTYDILIGHHQLPEALKLVALFPDQKFVLDHIAKPPVRAGELEPWKTNISRMAAHPQLYCKISGMVTEADWQHWQEDQIKPYLDVVFEAFGPDRLMYGSDWPVCLLAAPYQRVIGLVKGYIQQLSLTEQEKIMGGNARSFYNLSE